jgi:glycosyltransferase involved in cell wall biosynthesis
MRLSVVIASRDNPEELAACLDALAPQVNDEVEVLVVDASRNSSRQPVERTSGSVHILRAPVGCGLAQLRAAGLAHSAGTVVAFTDACCRVDAGWVERLRGQPWHTYAVVGGAVLPAPEPGLADWAAFLVEYGPYLPPRPAGEASQLPGNNVAFRRDALERAGLVGAPEFWKAFALPRLAAQGACGWFDPDLVVHHYRSAPAREWATLRYLHGRCFGANRAAASRRRWRLARAAMSPLVPFVLTARLVRTVQSKPAGRRHLWRSLPVLLAFHIAWAWGELDGYLRGRGDACARLA